MSIVQTIHKIIYYSLLHFLSILVLNYPLYLLIHKQNRVPKFIAVFVTFILKTYFFNWAFFCNIFKRSDCIENTNPFEGDKREQMDFTPDDIEVDKIKEEDDPSSVTNYPKEGGDYNYY